MIQYLESVEARLELCAAVLLQQVVRLPALDGALAAHGRRERVRPRPLGEVTGAQACSKGKYETYMCVWRTHKTYMCV